MSLPERLPSLRYSIATANRCQFVFSAYYVRQLVTLADYYDVKSLMKQCIELANCDIPNMEKLFIALKADDVALEASLFRFIWTPEDCIFDDDFRTK